MGDKIMGRKKETKPETENEVVEVAEENVEITPEMIEQCMGGSQEMFSYGLAEMLCMNDLENRIFYLDDMVTSDIFREITMFIIKANIQDAGIPTEERMPIKLVINSPGGSVLDGMGLIDAIKSSATPVFGIVVGYAFSMAFNILCACDFRAATANSSFLCHDGSTGLYDSSTKLRDTMKFYDKLDERLDKMIASKTKLTMKELETRKREENFWFSDEAKDLGIIDAIIGDDISFADIFCYVGNDSDCDCDCCSGS